MSEIQNLLDNEIVRRLKELDGMASGSKEIGVAIEDIEHLCKMRVEEKKLNGELESNAREERDKLLENAARAKDRYIRLGLDVAGLILPLAFYGIWMYKGFKFEESGTFTSTTFRSLFNRFKPTK
nr:MAG TPA: hypothetical protein [Caudoviricetes sp.]